MTWRMPVVGVDWLIDCCVTGNKAVEEKYSIETPRDMKELIKALDAIRQNEADSSIGGSEGYKASYGMTEKKSNLTVSDVTVDKPQDYVVASEKLSDSCGNQSDTSLTGSNESKKPRLDQSKSNKRF